MLFQALLTFINGSDEQVTIPMLEKMGMDFLLKPEFKEKPVCIEIKQEGIQGMRFLKRLKAQGDTPMLLQINEHGIVLYSTLSKNRIPEGDCTVFVPFGNILSISSTEFD